MSLWFSSRVSRNNCLEMNMASSYTCYSFVHQSELSLSHSTVIVENLRSPSAFTIRSLSSGEQFKLTNFNSSRQVLVYRIFTIKKLMASRTWLLVTVMFEMLNLRKFIVLVANFSRMGSSKFIFWGSYLISKLWSPPSRLILSTLNFKSSLRAT